MSFIQQWQARAQKKIHAIQHWLNQRRQQDLPLVVYSTLAGLTLWPVVELAATAAARGQSMPTAVYLGLASVAGSVGGNLLANQLQTWYDRAASGQQPTEADVMTWLAQNLPQQTELREAIDAMVEKLATIPSAQAALPVPEQPSFMAALRAELAQLGSLPRFEALLIGSGTLVQGDRNTVVGSRGVYVGGSVTGDVMTGDIIHDPAQPDPATLRRVYLERVLVSSNQLALSGIDPKAASETEERLELSAVYTALLTEKREQERPLPTGNQPPRRLSALELLDNQPRLVLLGDPGSGKSSFVNFVAACLAGEQLHHPQVNLKLLTTPLPPDDDNKGSKQADEKPQPQPWSHDLLPLPIVLRDLAARGLPSAGETATANHLWQFLTAELHKAALGEYAPLLKKELWQKGGLFLFDGLDEVPTAENHREHIKQLVVDVAHTFPNCRILVTSRTYAYQKQAWRLPDFTETTLAPFSQGQIAHFVERWYSYFAHVRHLDADDAQGRAQLLKQTIRGNRRLYALAERPLLLTLMASLHAWRSGNLPERREELYADAVDLLLDSWEQQRIKRDGQGKVILIQPSLEQWLGLDDRKKMAKNNAQAVIPSKKNRTVQRDTDWYAYKGRHLVECFINKIKQYRRIFSRFEKYASRYRSFLSFASALIWLR